MVVSTCEIKEICILRGHNFVHQREKKEKANFMHKVEYKISTIKSQFYKSASILLLLLLFKRN